MANHNPSHHQIYYYLEILLSRCSPSSFYVDGWLLLLTALASILELLLLALGLVLELLLWTTLSEGFLWLLLLTAIVLLFRKKESREIKIKVWILCSVFATLSWSLTLTAVVNYISTTLVSILALTIKDFSVLFLTITALVDILALSVLTIATLVAILALSRLTLATVVTTLVSN